MKKLFSLLIIAMSILVSCQKESVEPIAPVITNSVMSLTDSTKAALFGTSFTIVYDELVNNTNVVTWITSPTTRRMYDEWTIDASGSCTVTPYFYDCPSTYTYSTSSFIYAPILYSSPILFNINIHGDTVDLPFNNPFNINRVGGSIYSHSNLIYLSADPSGIGSRCFQTSLSGNFINRYSIK